MESDDRSVSADSFSISSEGLFGLNLIEVTSSPEACASVKAFSSKPFICFNDPNNFSGNPCLFMVRVNQKIWRYCFLHLLINQNYTNHFQFLKLFNMKRISIFGFVFLFFISANAQSFPDSHTDGKYYTVNGAKLWVVSFGTGDPLIIIPGGPGGR